jgi:hypothetical protein
MRFGPVRGERGLAPSSPFSGNAWQRARLFASVPPDVSTTSRASNGAPESAATASRARSTSARARRPGPCTLAGLAQAASQAARIAAITSGWGGAVAFQSR